MSFAARRLPIASASLQSFARPSAFAVASRAFATSKTSSPAQVNKALSQHFQSEFSALSPKESSQRLSKALDVAASKSSIIRAAALPIWTLPLHLDAAEPWQFGFQDSASVTHEGIVELHNSIMYFIVAITYGVFHMLGTVLYRFRAAKTGGRSHKYMNHGTAIELIWTITPALVLIAIAFPSFRLLYLMDEVISPALTLKVMGHQWYWSYEFCDFSVGEEGEEEE